MKNISEALDQYTGICKEALQDCASKLSKSFESVIIEVLLLYMVIPGKINFTQMGRYGRHCEQCYRQNFGRLRSKSLNWLRFNAALALRYFGAEGRKAIAIDPSCISKAGKKTPHIGRFWSGCAGAVKHGLEIMGLGLVDIDAHNCMVRLPDENRSPNAATACTTATIASNRVINVFFIIVYCLG